MSDADVVERALRMAGPSSLGIPAGEAPYLLADHRRRLGTDGGVTRGRTEGGVPDGRCPSAFEVANAREEVGSILGVDNGEPPGTGTGFRLASAILEDVTEAILVTKARPTRAQEQEIVYANGAFTDLTGYSPEELVGRTPRIILGPRTEPSRLREIEAALHESKPVRVELCCYRKDGTAFWNGLSVSPVRDGRGEVANFVWIQRDTTERKVTEKRLAAEALRDHLTGLPNRTLLADVLRRALDHSERFGRRVAVLFADLDDFKGVNDALGHVVGDQVLVAVARRLNGALRAGDTAARFGGDEFVLVLGDLAEAREAIEVVERIEERLRAPFRIGSLEISVDASVGIALSDGSGRGSAEDLVRAADAAMYEAKRRNKGRRRFDDAPPGGSTECRVRLGQRGLTGIDVGGLRTGASALPLLRGADPGGDRRIRVDGPSGEGKGLG